MCSFFFTSTSDSIWFYVFLYIRESKEIFVNIAIIKLKVEHLRLDTINTEQTKVNKHFICLPGSQKRNLAKKWSDLVWVFILLDIFAKIRIINENGCTWWREHKSSLAILFAKKPLWGANSELIFQKARKLFPTKGKQAQIKGKRGYRQTRDRQPDDDNNRR